MNLVKDVVLQGQSIAEFQRDYSKDDTALSDAIFNTLVVEQAMNYKEQFHQGYDHLGVKIFSPSFDMKKILILLTILELAVM